MKFLPRKCSYNTVCLSFSLGCSPCMVWPYKHCQTYHRPHTTVIWHQITWITWSQWTANHSAPKILNDVANELLEVWVVAPCCWKNLYFLSVIFSKNCPRICVIYILLNLLCPEIWIWLYFLHWYHNILQLYCHITAFHVLDWDYVLNTTCYFEFLQGCGHLHKTMSRWQNKLAMDWLHQHTMTYKTRYITILPQHSLPPRFF